MSTELVHRAARATTSQGGATRRAIERPPALPEGDSGWGGLLMLVPLLGAGASMTVMMLFRGSSMAAVGALMMIVTIIASVVMLFSQRGKAARARRAQREAYLGYLERVRTELQQIERDRLHRLRDAAPHPQTLLALVRARRRLWERRRGDSDFLVVRLGTGPVHLHDFERQGEQDALRRADDFMQAELEHLEARFADCADAPVDVALNGVGPVSVVGDLEFCHRVARVVLSQAAALVSPEDLHLALSVPPQRRSAWDWATWLPHAVDPGRASAPGPLLRVARTVPDLVGLLDDDLSRRIELAVQRRRNLTTGGLDDRCAPLWVLADEHGERAHDLPIDVPDVSAASMGLTVIHLVSCVADEPGEVALRIRQDGHRPEVALVQRYARRDEAPQEQRVRLDEWGPQECSTLARTLAGFRLSPEALEHDDTHDALGIRALLGIEDPSAVDLDRAWAPRPRASFLRVPIGVDDSGEPLLLDFKESAQSGMGPHGLCIGATGSGKSELLRTLVLALLTTHGPQDVAMVLVDYKGGATFAPFADAPHVHGVITNLNDDAVLVERVYASLAGEVRRRQEMLKQAGHLADITAYRRHRGERAAAGENLAAMPHLLVIIDEFGELLTARPDFIELFLSIGRIGRSIGVHLLLSSQRIEAGKLRGLETYLSYRIGLRTLSESESRTVLDTPDAFALPAPPGYGYLRVDTSIYRRFRAGFVSGPVPPPEEEAVDGDVVVHPIPPYPTPRSQERPPGPREGVEREDEPSGPTVLSAAVQCLAGRCRVGPAVWSAPLPDQLSLDQVHPGGVVSTRAGLRIHHTRPLRVPMGLMDDPAHQWQGPWEIDLGEPGSNVLVLGAPRSGRTTFLRTLAASLSLTHSAADVVIYGVDALGSNLRVLAALPIVAGVGGRMEAEVIARVIDEVHALMTHREAVFQQTRTESLEALRAVVSGAHRPELSAMMLADVVLLVDGYGPLLEEHPSCAEALGALIRRGPAYGIRIVASVSRWNEIRLSQQTFFAATVELRLGDPAESGVGRKLAETLAGAVPGRCLLSSGHFAQIALPRIDAVPDRTSTAQGLSALLQRVSSAAPIRATGLRVLPASVSAADLLAAGPGMVSLGIDEAHFGTVSLDLDGSDRHLLVVGDTETGRTGLLRHLAASLIRQYSPEELVLAQLDPRRSMRAEIPGAYLGGYAGSTTLAHRLVEGILPELEERARRLADAVGSFTAPMPRIVLLVDDYDVLTASGSSPLQPLVPYVAMAREINLNVIVARRTNGASRGIFEPAYAALREFGATGLLLSGDRGEGPLFGSVRPQRLPPGRALLVRGAGAPQTVQTVHAPAAGSAGPGGRGLSGA